MYASSNKSAMPAVSSVQLKSVTLTGIEVPDPATATKSFLKHVNDTSLLYCFFSARLAANAASHEDICELVRLVPQNIHQSMIETAGGDSVYLRMQPPGLQICDNLAVESLKMAFAAPCPFYDPGPCREAENWVRERLYQSSSTRRKFEIALHEMVDDSTAGKLAKAIGIERAPLARTAVQSNELMFANTKGTLIAKSNQLLQITDSGNVSALKTLAGMMFFHFLTGEKLVSGALDDSLAGKLEEILSKTTLRLTDILVLFGITPSSSNPFESEPATCIPQRLWKLGYNVTLHAMLSEDKCSFATLKTFFQSLDFLALADEHLKYARMHIYDTLKVCIHNKCLKWLKLTDLQLLLNVTSADVLVEHMRSLDDFLFLSELVEPLLTYKVWTLDLKLNVGNLQARFARNRAATEVNEEEAFKVLEMLQWPANEAKRLARLANPKPVPVINFGSTSLSSSTALATPTAPIISNPVPVPAAEPPSNDPRSKLRAAALRLTQRSNATGN